MPTGPQAERAKIMIVEDDEFLQSLMAARLAREGFQVVTATNGLQALSLVSDGVPDLMLLDLLMPEMNGFEVLKRLKADPGTKDIGVIVFSNLSQEHEIEEAKRLGAAGVYLKSSFTLKELADKIQVLLEEKGKGAKRG